MLKRLWLLLIVPRNIFWIAQQFSKWHQMSLFFGRDHTNKIIVWACVVRSFMVALKMILSFEKTWLKHVFVLISSNHMCEWKGDQNYILTLFALLWESGDFVLLWTDFQVKFDHFCSTGWQNIFWPQIKKTRFYSIFYAFMILGAFKN